MEPTLDLMKYLRQSDGLKTSTFDSLARHGLDSAQTLMAIDLTKDLPQMTDISIGQRALLKQLIREFKTCDQMDNTLCESDQEIPYKEAFHKIQTIVDSTHCRESKNSIKKLKITLSRTRAELARVREELKDTNFKRDQEVKALSSEIRQLKKKRSIQSSNEDNSQTVIQKYGKYLIEKDNKIQELEENIERLKNKNVSILDQFSDYTQNNYNNLKQLKAYLTNDSMAIHRSDSAQERDDNNPKETSEQTKNTSPQTSSPLINGIQTFGKYLNISATNLSPIDTVFRRTGRPRKPPTKLSPTIGKTLVRSGPKSAQKRQKLNDGSHSVDKNTSHNLVIVSSEELDSDTKPNEKHESMTLSSITAHKLVIDINGETDKESEENIDGIDFKQNLFFKQKMVLNEMVSHSATSNGYLMDNNNENKCLVGNTLAPTTSSGTDCIVSPSVTTTGQHKGYSCSMPDCDFTTIFDNMYKDHITNHVSYHFGQEIPDNWRPYFEQYKQTLPEYSKAK